MTSSVPLTDPAKELVELCVSLKGGGKTQAAEYLAKKFGVPSLSSAFWQIIYVITKRIDDLTEMLTSMEMDEDIKADAMTHLRSIRTAFGPTSLTTNWSNAEDNFLSPVNVQAIKMLSPHVRKVCRYPKLGSEDVSQVVAEVHELRQWLTDHQLSDQDFIRQALMDGLSQLGFRLTHIGWLGWGYTIESLREVISAYIMLEWGAPDQNVSPDAAAALRKIKHLIVGVFEKARLAKDVYETGDFALKAYGATTILLHGGSAVAGLLTFLG